MARGAPCFFYFSTFTRGSRGGLRVRLAMNPIASSSTSVQMIAQPNVPCATVKGKRSLLRMMGSVFVRERAKITRLLLSR